MEYCFDLKNVPEEYKNLIGGKAGSLATMFRNTKVRIPEGAVVIASAFEASGTEAAGSETTAIKPEALAQIKTVINNLDKTCTYAVRSSALNEDGNAISFAGQYETITDVAADKILEAVEKVITSSDSGRVKTYTDTFNEKNRGMAVVIQRFVRPEFAGVLFTSDIITGREDYYIGNYVRGEGEKLVSGSENAAEFKINAIKYGYEGTDEFKQYATCLYRYCKEIRDLYNMPMDIEWAVADKKVYILQARPITTLKRLNADTYEINGSKSGCKLLTKTNVGEIFMKPVTPMTFSVLEKINEILGLPDWLDNIYGQAYMNISVMCSLAVSVFGVSKEKALHTLRELAGNVPEGTEIYLTPFDKKAWLKRIKTLLFPKEKCKLSRKQKKEMVENLQAIANDKIKEIRGLKSNEELKEYWEKNIIPSLKDGLSSILTESGTSLVALFGTKEKISKIAGEDMANRLCSGCVGVLDSMKPLLLLEDVIEGKITEEEYLKVCGQRCVNEMELMEPRPYEIESYVKDLIEEHQKSNVNMHAMQATVQEEYEKALSEFKALYPNKRKWVDNKLNKFVKANQFRENIRSKGVWIFCVYREFLLKVGSVNNIGDDVFMLMQDEIARLISDDASVIDKIQARKENYNKYRNYSMFPNLILGSFDPDKWEKDENKRRDFYSSFDSDSGCTDLDSSVKGFPGAAGVIEGIVKVITDIKDIDKIEDGDILVTTATNVGWTLVFPKVSAVITDIGAPLSHAAIVAREFGIPAIVGCGNATGVLKTGDKILVDGSKGTVKILQRAV